MIRRLSPDSMGRSQLLKYKKSEHRFTLEKMTPGEFEQQFSDFYIDFGYKADGNLPDSINVKEFFESENLVTQLDNLDAVIREHAQQESYYVVLTWRTLTVGTYTCTESEYQNQIVPQEHEHPAELTIVNTFVTTPEQIQQTYQERECQWQLTVEEYNSQTNNAD